MDNEEKYAYLSIFLVINVILKIILIKRANKVT